MISKAARQRRRERRFLCKLAVIVWMLEEATNEEILIESKASLNITIRVLKNLREGGWVVRGTKRILGRKVRIWKPTEKLNERISGRSVTEEA